VVGLRLAETLRGKLTLVIGATDTGKTTLIKHAAGLIGEKPAIIDADIGQGWIGPPLSLGLAIISEKSQLKTPNPLAIELSSRYNLAANLDEHACFQQPSSFTDELAQQKSEGAR